MVVTIGFLVERKNCKLCFMYKSVTVMWCIAYSRIVQLIALL